MNRFVTVVDIVCDIDTSVPSIEIICVDQIEPIGFGDLPFAVVAEDRLISHRTPSPLFQADFDDLKGCIYHLGNPDLRDPDVSKCYTAFELLSKEHNTEWWYWVHFAPEYAEGIRGIRGILEQLLIASPSGTVLFTSDYQFALDAKRYKRPLTLERFWRLHDERKLKMNALYKLKR